MIDSRRTRRWAAAVWRTTRRAAAALRAIHDEQVLMWEMFWQSGRAPVDRSGQLAWILSLDRPRLTGSRLPLPREPRAGRRAQPADCPGHAGNQAGAPRGQHQATR